MNIRIAFFLSVAFLISSCHKDLPAVQSAEVYPGNSYSSLFEAFWNGMNDNYVYWSIDSTNWDNVYTKYKPLFNNLTQFDTASENKAFNYFNEMCAGLIDSHFNLDYIATGRSFNPSVNKYLTNDPNFYVDSLFPTSFIYQLVTSKYIDSSSLVMGTDNIPGNGFGASLTAASGTINDQILYLFFSSFDISKAGENTKPVFDYFFNTIHNLPPNIKGIIIDLRGNPGGEVIDLDYILGQMIKKKQIYGYTRTKSGTGRLDFNPWAPATVNTWNGGEDIKVPIVALGDHASTSMAEITSLAIKSLPNGKYIGTRTWGATGPVAPKVFYNGGSFVIGGPATAGKGYMSVYTSAAMFKGLHGEIYEGVGVPPDIYALQNYDAFSDNHDLAIDAALKYIQSQE